MKEPRHYLDRYKRYYYKNKDKILARKQAWELANKEHRIAYRRHKYYYVDRERKLLNLYGLTLDQYDNLFIEQAGLCPICQKPLQGAYNDTVDHDHRTGEVRGIMHSICNIVLGQVEAFGIVPMLIDTYLRSE